MEPHFALTLSSDGIDLLHRGTSGWAVVGAADPSSPQLNDQMNALVETACALAGDDLRCKIILPDDQVKYLSVPTPGLDAQARAKAALQALEVATPYSGDELVFDLHEEGEETQVAAVAKVTLEEAAGFIADYGFEPACYVAQPADGNAFAIEPVFALTETGLAATAEPELPAASSTDIREQEPELAGGRRVPTFRTVPEAPALHAGFAEPAQPFSTTSAPRTKPPADKAAAGTARARNEKERMTVFGTRAGTGLARGMGPLGVTAVVAGTFFLGFLAFAGTALGTNVTSFFALLNAPKPTAQFTAPQQPTTPGDLSTPQAPEAQVELAALNRTLTDEDNAVLDALKAPVLGDPTPRSDRTSDEMRAAYAVTGIWPVAPDVPSPPSIIELDNLYETSIDPVSLNFDAVALPAPYSQGADSLLLAPTSPAPAGTKFVLDARGFVVPSREGALNPDGIPVFTGPPPVRQPRNLLRIDEPGEDLAELLRLSTFRPKARPDDLIETSERASFGGLTRTELGEFRPRLRPSSAQETALAAASLVPLDNSAGRPLVEEPQDPLASATARAVPVSLRPDTRPLNFAAVVARSQNFETASPTPTLVAAASVAPRAVTPTIPSSASAARQATVKNAINLRKVNLIGVYGKPSSRRALVRLGNGRYRKVEVGDRIDGGRVSAIGDAELRYQKSGRAIVLKMPKG